MLKSVGLGKGEGDVSGLLRSVVVDNQHLLSRPLFVFSISVNVDSDLMATPVRCVVPSV